MASTLTHVRASHGRTEDAHELAVEGGLRRIASGVLGRDPFGPGDVLEVAYAGSAEQALLKNRLAGLAEVVGPDPIF